MNYTVKFFKEFGRNITYIKELNNYFEVSEDLAEKSCRMSREELLQFVKEHREQDYDKFVKLTESRDTLQNEEHISYEKDNDRYTLCIHPSRKCNLACKYCFGEEDHLVKEEISFEVIKDAIDFLLYQYGKNGRQYFIDLSGSGEPLLRFDIIKQIEAYADEKRNELGKDVVLMFCTNATLVDKEKADYLKSRPRILLGVSIDGNEAQNVNRVYKNEKQVYEDVMRGITYLAPKPLGLAVTVTKENENVDEIFDSLYQIPNCDCISIQNVRNFTDGEQSFYNVDHENVFHHYEKLLNNMYEHIEQGDYEYFNKLIKGADTLGGYIQKAFFKGKLNQYRCDGGKSRLVVDNEGNIYTCSVMNGCRDFYIGNIYSGIDEDKKRKYARAVDNTSSRCAECWAAYICSGECSAVSYYTHGELYEPNEKLCTYRQRLIRLAIGFWVHLETNYPQKYKELKELIINVAGFETSDSGVWAVFTLLKILGKDPQYSDVICNLERGNRGAHPSVVEKFLSENIGEYGIYQVDDSEVLKDIDKPFIVWMNKIHAQFYEYCVVVSQDDTNICFRINGVNDLLTEKKSNFLQNIGDVIICRE